MENVQKEEFLKFNKDAQITITLLCLKEKQKELKIPPKFVLIKIFKEINYFFEDSTILNDKKHQGMLIKWILETENIPKEFTKLLYKATRDGFESRKFHENCDHKVNTISIIKANEFIFGGFASVSWHRGLFGDYKEDSKSFIFSISNPTNQPIKSKCTKTLQALLCSNNFGPTFGKDLHISNNSNQNEKSISKLGHSFEERPFNYGTEEADKFLCGSKRFKVQEVEVFQLF